LFIFIFFLYPTLAIGSRRSPSFESSAFSAAVLASPVVLVEVAEVEALDLEEEFVEREEDEEDVGAEGGGMILDEDKFVIEDTGFSGTILPSPGINFNSFEFNEGGASDPNSSNSDITSLFFEII